MIGLSGGTMRRLTIMLFAMAISATAFAAEPRWCSVSSRDPSNTVSYTPIAAAAKVQGEVRAQITYRPNGPVEHVELLPSAPLLTGPLIPLLTRPLVDQLSKWTVRSRASGNELCQTLVVVDFKLRMPVERGKEKVRFTRQLNTIRIHVSRPWPRTYEYSAIRSPQQAF